MDKVSKANARRKRKADKVINQNHEPFLRLVKEEEKTRPPRKARTETVKPLNDAQRRYDAAIKSSTVVFGTGPAGTGKTWFAAMRAAEAFKAGEIDAIVITRPAVEAGESLGYLPGDLDEKFEPYFRPVRDAFEEAFGTSKLDYLIKTGKIEARPLALLRGATFKNCWVLLDEAQNTTPTQMKMFLTRIGEGAKVIVNGDIRQKDIAGKSGLVDALHKLRGLAGVSLVEFSRADVVRSGICQAIVERYETDDTDGGDDDDGLRRILKIG